MRGFGWLNELNHQSRSGVENGVIIMIALIFFIFGGYASGPFLDIILLELIHSINYDGCVHLNVLIDVELEWMEHTCTLSARLTRHNGAAFAM